MTNQVDTHGIQTQEMILKALKNMGHDTTCGACMALAFTGDATGTHTHSTEYPLRKHPMASILKELGEFEGLSQLVSVFADKMRVRLWEKMQEGVKGWADRDNSDTVLEDMRERLSLAVTKYLDGDRNQIIDIANLSAIIWLHESADERAIPYLG